MLPGYVPQVILFFRPVSRGRRRPDSGSFRILQRKIFIEAVSLGFFFYCGMFVPFSRLSICSFVKEVLFLCSFRFSLSLSCESSSPDELCSELPSEVFSCIASAEKDKNNGKTVWKDTNLKHLATNTYNT